ncbi:MAG TPA: PLP-dependent transferase [Polyangiaceae bacterium]|nr:PLP-dependent transferase [Polyangiaceae bacterium]
MAANKAADAAGPAVPQSFDTLVVHAGREIDHATGAVAPPIVVSSTYTRDPDGELTGEHLYGRYGNPTRDRLERCLCALEGAAEGRALASGSAVAHVLLSCLEQGDQLVVSHDMYFGTRRLLTQLCARCGVTLRSVDLSDDDALEEALAARPRLVMCESPTNPLMEVVDLERLAERVHAAEASLLVDNTMATPVLQRPLELGADFVMHSTTKFLSGHSDVIGGALLTKDPSHPMWERALDVHKLGGAVPSPFDCWLLLRSVATLKLRVERQVDNAEQLASWLDGQPAIDRVLYPGLASHPGHAIADRQMRRPGAMLSLLVRDGFEGAHRFTGALQLVVRATSLGGVHTLAEHRAQVEGPDTSTPPNLVRLSVGIEAVDDLRADLERALAAV